MSAMKETVSVKPEVTKAEDVLGEKWDRCLADSATKFATGIALGGVFSLLLFKRRTWPVIFGGGAGFGMGYANCQNEIGRDFRAASRGAEEGDSKK